MDRDDDDSGGGSVSGGDGDGAVFQGLEVFIYQHRDLMKLT